MTYAHKHVTSQRNDICPTPPFGRPMHKKEIMHCSSLLTFLLKEKLSNVYDCVWKFVAWGEQIYTVNEKHLFLLLFWATIFGAAHILEDSDNIRLSEPLAPIIKFPTLIIALWTNGQTEYPKDTCIFQENLCCQRSHYNPFEMSNQMRSHNQDIKELYVL